MSKTHAIKIVRDTFESPFERGRYINFVRELLNSFEDDSFSPRKGTYIPHAFSEHVESLERVGVYRQAEKRIDILIVHLKKETSLERARTMQRNFVAGYLRGDYDSANPKDAALVAFVSAKIEDWRFSLVKLEYALEENDKGQLKGIEKFTPARRWSFLVGENEKSHTAQTQLEPILADDENNPTLERLEEAFDIEKVSDDFFVEYRRLFIETKSALDDVLLAEASLKSEFEAKQINSVDFAKKLLGQIVFLYYLQKKGWFGVPRHGAWGEGSKNFLRELFEKKHGEYQNFFNDILEPLFYEALRRDRSDVDHYYSRFNCKIPFLNGGLFDPIHDYDWWELDLLLPNELFANTKVVNGDEGTGVLDVFDRYNFTVREDEPFEKEVAIDPELLGKAYEKFNAIRPDNFDEYLEALDDGKKGSESKFNKKFGVYYTPREIVHYMCQQSLIQYLHTALNEQKSYREFGTEQQGMFGNENRQGQLAMAAEAELPVISIAEIEDLILRGDRIRELDARLMAKGDENKTKIPKSIRLNAARVDEALASVKVCDPAVGSGAFPVGMMNEIVKARDVLRNYTQASEAYENSEVSTYQFKRACIENSLYGVDIDPGAVEIAKLRLWLSLIVDEEDPQNIKPLPNLDYKLMQGNSLLGLPQGALLNPETLEKLEERIKLYFDETHPTKKKEYRKKISALFGQLVESASQFTPELGDVNFDFYTYFSEVFKDGGFDILIANPPYVGESGNKDLFRPIALGNLGGFYQGKMDLFYFFFHLALNIGKNESVCTFITTNYYVTATGAKKLRQDLEKRSTVKAIVNFNELKIFGSALGQHNMITIFSKGKEKTTLADIVNTHRHGVADGNIISKITNKADEETEYIKASQKDLFDGKESYLRLSGIGKQDTTQKLLNKLASSKETLGAICNVNQGVVSGCDYVSGRNIKKIKNVVNIQKNDGIFVFDLDNPRDRRVIETFSNNEKELLRSFYKNSDIRRYWSSFTPRKRLLYYQAGLDEKKYPNVYRHLIKYSDILKGRLETYGEAYHWTALHRSRDENIFSVPKIVVPYRSSINSFAYNENEWFCRSDCYVITSKNNSYDLKYILALLNSNLYFLWLYHRGKRKGNILELFQVPLSEIPIPSISEDKQQPFIKLVSQIITLKNDNPSADMSAIEAQIDALVYELYGLTEEEIAVVEGKNL